VCGPNALFGTELSEITSMNNPIPLAIRKLMQQIEQNGLYILGIYRKPGLQAAVNNLKSVLTSLDAEDLLLEDEKPHVLASTLKLFFRQLPSPLICEEFYEDFIRSTSLDTTAEVHATLYDLIQRFPKANRELLERLIFHLARVAMHEDTNKMSPNGLSIIWAPCVMRPPPDMDPMEGLAQLPQQTKCIEILISSQVEKMYKIMEEIDVLERASSTYEKRLSDVLRERFDPDGKDGAPGIGETSEEAELLQDQISTIDEERRRLTGVLATMEPRSKKVLSDSGDELTSDDGLETDNEMYGSYEDLTNAVYDNTGSSSTTSSNHAKLARQSSKKQTEKRDSSFEDLELKQKGDSRNRTDSQLLAEYGLVVNDVNSQQQQTFGSSKSDTRKS